MPYVKDSVSFSKAPLIRVFVHQVREPLASPRLKTPKDGRMSPYARLLGARACLDGEGCGVERVGRL